MGISRCYPGGADPAGASSVRTTAARSGAIEVWRRLDGDPGWGVARAHDPEAAPERLGEATIGRKLITDDDEGCRIRLVAEQPVDGADHRFMGLARRLRLDTRCRGDGRDDRPAAGDRTGGRGKQRIAVGGHESGTTTDRRRRQPQPLVVEGAMETGDDHIHASGNGRFVIAAERRRTRGENRFDHARTTTHQNALARLDQLGGGGGRRDHVAVGDDADGRQGGRVLGDRRRRGVGHEHDAHAGLS